MAACLVPIATVSQACVMPVFFFTCIGLHFNFQVLLTYLHPSKWTLRAPSETPQILFLL
jgi:hypothetical protein